MSTFLALLLIAAMLATVAALVRGIVVFLKANHDEVHGAGGPSESALKSNRMMQYRILFQAIAVLIGVVILFAAGKT